MRLRLDAHGRDGRGEGDGVSRRRATGVPGDARESDAARAGGVRVAWSYAGLVLALLSAWVGSLAGGAIAASACGDSSLCAGGSMLAMALLGALVGVVAAAVIGRLGGLWALLGITVVAAFPTLSDLAQPALWLVVMVMPLVAALLSEPSRSPRARRLTRTITLVVLAVCLITTFI